MASGIGSTMSTIGKNAYVAGSNVNNDVLSAINGNSAAQNRVGSSNYYGMNINPADIANAILSSLNLSDPSSYLQSAWDIANLNTMTSQAMAREQMRFQEQANALAMEFNATEAQKVRDWEELMSSTAHQREVQDLIKAGLNPVLSANQGASSPAAPSAQGVTSSGAKGSVDTSMVSAMVGAYQTAWNMRMQEKQIDAQILMNALNNETTRYAADKGAYGAVTAAGLNSSAQRYSADINKLIYEQGYHGIDSMAGNVIDMILDGSWNILGNENPSQAIKNQLLESMPWASSLINKIFPDTPSGRTSMNNDAQNGSGYRTHSR